MPGMSDKPPRRTAAQMAAARAAERAKHGIGRRITRSYSRSHQPKRLRATKVTRRRSPTVNSRRSRLTASAKQSRRTSDLLRARRGGIPEIPAFAFAALAAIPEEGEGEDLGGLDDLVGAMDELSVGGKRRNYRRRR
jgi:hypothetical protein